MDTIFCFVMDSDFESRLWDRLVSKSLKAGSYTGCSGVDAPGCYIVGEDKKFLVCDYPVRIDLLEYSGKPSGCYRIYYDDRACVLKDDVLYCRYAVKMPVEPCLCPWEEERRRRAAMRKKKMLL